MAYKNLQHFIETLEKEGELIRIKEYVNPKLEIAEITDRISKTAGGGKARWSGREVIADFRFLIADLAKATLPENRQSTIGNRK